MTEVYLLKNSDGQIRNQGRYVKLRTLSLFFSNKYKIKISNYEAINQNQE